jgi:hypothetical protein
MGKGAMETVKPCKFTFDDAKIFDGFAHGSTWNGFDNVAVTKDEWKKIIAWFEFQGFNDDEIRFRGFEPMENDLISLGWRFTTRIVR